MADIDSARGANALKFALSSPDELAARRSPRGASARSPGNKAPARTSLGALPSKRAAEPDARAVPERRVLFADEHVAPALLTPRVLPPAHDEPLPPLPPGTRTRCERAARLGSPSACAKPLTWSSPAWRVRWVPIRSGSGRRDRRYYAPDGAVYSGPVPIIERI